MRDYRELIVYQIAYDLVLQVYSIMPFLPEYEQKNIGDQLRRCATSIPINIAEGTGANSNKVLFNHLSYAYGSAKELGVLIQLCRDLKYIDEETYNKLNDRNETFKAKMYKYLVTLEESLVNKQWHAFFSQKNQSAAYRIKQGIIPK
ncbi:four helix bundle protein [Candidatus Woesearchaeota archaeon]|nr:four helix bundle protein [Candidatus Woesearchaeota archaeon]